MSRAEGGEQDPGAGSFVVVAEDKSTKLGCYSAALTCIDLAPVEIRSDRRRVDARCPLDALRYQTPLHPP